MCLRRGDEQREEDDGLHLDQGNIPGWVKQKRGFTGSKSKMVVLSYPDGYHTEMPTKCNHAAVGNKSGPIPNSRTYLPRILVGWGL